MALFNRNNPDRDRGGYWGGSPEYGGGRNERGGGFMDAARRGLNRVENGVRDAFDRGGYDRDFSGRTDFGAGGSNMGGRGWGNTGGQDRGFAGGGSHLGYRGTEPGWGAAWGGGYDRDFSARRGMDLGRTDFGRGMNTGGTEDYTDRSDRGLDYGRRMHARGMEETWEHGGEPGMDREWNRAVGGEWNQGMGRTTYGAGRGGMMGGGMDMDRDRGMLDRDRGFQHRAETDNGDPFGDRQNRTPIRVLRGGFDRWETDRGDWGRGDRLNQLGRGGTGEVRYDRDYRGWNQGVGDEPYYNTQDFRGNYDREFRGRDRDRDWF
jgi:hypothetical protein